MNIEYLELSPASAATMSGAIVRVYAAAFEPPPYLRGEPEARAFSDIFLRQRSQTGFRCIIAREAALGGVVGFVYGFTSLPGQWWHDQVAQRMNVTQRERWLGSAFEVTELAVLPAYQGFGIGGRLHDRVLTGLSQRTAVLSTMQTETNALALYRKRGWQMLLSDFLFSGAVRMYTILGKELAAN